jgi:hypothetical protein
MRLLYLYPEEWTGRRAREVHSLATCVALAEYGVEVTLVTGGGEQELHDQLVDLADAMEIPGLHLVVLSRALGPVQSTSIFSRNFNHWLRNRRPFDLGYIVHLKAGPILSQAHIPYAYEAHGIFTQMPQNAARQRMLHKVEGQVLNAAELLVATSMPLAMALNTWFGLSKDIAIVPNAGLPPLTAGIGNADGPFVFCGSIGEGSELTDLIHASRETRMPLKIVGGFEEEWRLLGEQIDTREIEWHARVAVSELPEMLAGARAGLIPTNPDAASGEFSCPMKIFDYARCGLPVISTMLSSLQSLDTGTWCTQIPSPSRVSWVEAMRHFRYEADQAEAARAWSGEHTWAMRADLLGQAFGINQ